MEPNACLALQRRGKDMRSSLSSQAKRELFLHIAPRSREASSRLKEVILEEFVAATA